MFHFFPDRFFRAFISLLITGFVISTIKHMLKVQNYVVISN